MTETKANISNKTGKLWMDNLPLVTIPKAHKQSTTNLVTIHGATNKSLPAPQLQFTKQSIMSTSKCCHHDNLT